MQLNLYYHLECLISPTATLTYPVSEEESWPKMAVPDSLWCHNFKSVLIDQWSSFGFSLFGRTCISYVKCRCCLTDKYFHHIGASWPFTTNSLVSRVNLRLTPLILLYHMEDQIEVTKAIQLLTKWAWKFPQMPTNVMQCDTTCIILHMQVWLPPHKEFYYFV